MDAATRHKLLVRRGRLTRAYLRAMMEGDTARVTAVRKAFWRVTDKIRPKG